MTEGLSRDIFDSLYPGDVLILMWVMLQERWVRVYPEMHRVQFTYYIIYPHKNSVGKAIEAEVFLAKPAEGDSELELFTKEPIKTYTEALLIELRMKHSGTYKLDS